RILKLHKFHPYHVSLHQELEGNDFQNRLTFCHWAVHEIQTNQNFFARVLFSDESTFTNHGEVNRHNMHYWNKENPHWIREVNHQRPWSVNVWCGIIGDKLIGPNFINGTLNGEKYKNMLENDLPGLLEDLSIELRQNMWFQHDGCPAHNSLVAREVLNRVYCNRWIGRGGTVNWLARSPDLTSPDFFLWGYLKDVVYKETPTTRENMMQRIRDACAAI
ncbi:Transposable element Tc3 transposase, partial [Camponotus floridanus]